MGNAKNTAIGCAIDIAMLAIFAIAMSEKTMVSALVYAILFALPATGLRFILIRTGTIGERGARFLGPAFMTAAMLLAVLHPVKMDDGNGGETPITPRTAAEKTAEAVAKKPESAGEAQTPHWLRPPPPGVKYVAADTNSVSVEAALAELNGLVGLKPVKEEVERFVKFVHVAQQRKAAGLKSAPISYHMVFTGNPGTGKTTVARIMAKIYKALGVVKNGHLVECDRGGLVAGYTGQTAIKTAKVIDFALDGILFIDEAYSLVNGPQDSYGDEAISTLLKRMEDDRDRLVVIVAGYTHEMRRFIDANSGLASRFNHYVEFPDYSAKELAEIFRLNAKKSQYTLSADVERWLEPFISVKTGKRDRKFGNGRWVRNLFEHSIERQAVRVSGIDSPTREQLMTIEMKDVGIKLKDPDASKED